MERITRQTTSEDVGIRLDAFLARMLGVTRSRAQGLIAQGNVWVNGAVPGKAGVSLREGDQVEAVVPPPEPVRAVAQTIPLCIVYQDEHIAVIDKARGMVVHPAAGHANGTLVNALLGSLTDLSGIGGELRPGIVHRLDKDTTGLLVVAKHDAAHNALSEQLKTREAGREYLALALGKMGGTSGSIDAPIARHPKDRKRMGIVPGGREALTLWQTEQALGGCTLLRVKLMTGRTHQIRVHMRHIGHPLLGDPLYGVKGDKTPVLMLHAHRLTILHPATGESMTFTAPPPEDFLQVLRAKGGTDSFEHAILEDDGKEG
jgi:23S rRNA pseudouridine1911/1915/1917 synthase